VTIDLEGVTFTSPGEVLFILEEVLLLDGWGAWETPWTSSPDALKKEDEGGGHTWEKRGRGRNRDLRLEEKSFLISRKDRAQGMFVRGKG